MPILVKATNHTAFTVADLPEALAFFHDLLGFAVTPIVRQKGDAVDRITGLAGAELDIAFAECPGHRIELMQYLSPLGREAASLRPCDPGFAHVAFEVEDIDTTIAVLDAAGYPPVNPPAIVPTGPRKGGKNVYLHGPTGVVLEFQQAPTAPQGTPRRKRLP